MSTLPVVEEILRETKVPMSVREIVEYAKGSLPTKSKTPDTVVARDLSMDIKRKGEESLFCRVAPGRYTLRALVEAQSIDTAPTSMVAAGLSARSPQERAGTLGKDAPAKAEDKAERPASPLP